MYHIYTRMLGTRTCVNSKYLRPRRNSCWLFISWDSSNPVIVRKITGGDRDGIFAHLARSGITIAAVKHYRRNLRIKIRLEAHTACVISSLQRRHCRHLREMPDGRYTLRPTLTVF